jgi:hypothetical protein
MMDYEKQSDPKLADNAMSTEHEDRLSAKMAGQAQEALTPASFAHLDEKKILRKVCCSHRCPTCPCDELKIANYRVKMDLRLIPMLALLYLLSFLDRELPLLRTIILVTVLITLCCAK